MEKVCFSLEWNGVWVMDGESGDDGAGELTCMRVE